MSVPTRNECTLVNIMFEVAMFIHTDRRFENMTREEIAEWIGKQLDGCGFKGGPVGMSWYSLKEVP